MHSCLVYGALAQIVKGKDPLRKVCFDHGMSKDNEGNAIFHVPSNLQAVVRFSKTCWRGGRYAMIPEWFSAWIVNGMTD